MKESRPIMKWMTMAWWRGDVDQDSARGYSQHFDQIKSRLPENLRDWHERVTLHDAHLLSFKADFAAKTLRIELEGYRWEADTFPDKHCHWSLYYIGVEAIRSIASPNGGLGGPSGFGDLGYDELDVIGDGLYEHNMLFSTSIELSVRFRELAYQIYGRD